MFVDKNIRELLEIIVFLKKSDWKNINYYYPISLRTYYRRIYKLNIFLKNNQLPVIKINYEIINEDIKKYNNFLILLNNSVYIELTNFELALIFMIDFYHYKQIKISTWRQKHNLSLTDWNKTKKLINENCEQNVFKKHFMINNILFCNFFCNWLIKYFSKKNILSILLNNDLKKYLPKLIFLKIEQVIKLDNYKKTLKLIELIDLNNLTFKDFFYLSLHIFSWLIYDLKNFSCKNFYNLILPKKVKKVISAFVRIKNSNIKFKQIYQKVKNVLYDVDQKICINNYFVQILSINLSRKDNLEFLDNFNLSEYNQMSKTYPNLKKVFKKILANILLLKKILLHIF